MIDLNSPLVDLEGKATPVVKGRVLATLLAAAQSGDAEKWWDWATALFAGRPIEVTSEEKEQLLKFVNEHSALTVASKAQLMRAIKEQ